jgi:transposase
LALDGMLYAKIVEGLFTAVRFRDFIEGLLDQMEPFPGPKSVIIMDNAHIHKDPRLLDLIHAQYGLFLVLIFLADMTFRGMRVLFLPPYSSDLNPIELAFSAIKAFVRRDKTLGREDLDQKVDDTYVYVHLMQAAFSITETDALGFFHHCGYI